MSFSHQCGCRATSMQGHFGGKALCSACRGPGAVSLQTQQNPERLAMPRWMRCTYRQVPDLQAGHTAQGLCKSSERLCLLDGQLGDALGQDVLQLGQAAAGTDGQAWGAGLCWVSVLKEGIVSTPIPGHGAAWGLLGPAARAAAQPLRWREGGSSRGRRGPPGAAWLPADHSCH